ncbi:MAG: hypothetical protein QM652_05550 [Legionella sp.]|uniref:CBU_0585 family protein n=1 Tax=Legionella sp. TaxID=459 RepID=UPI0039E706A6
MSTTDIDKFYVSPYDKFMFEFDATHSKSESQLQEIKKHQLIAKMRDDKNYEDNKGKIWEGF